MPIKFENVGIAVRDLEATIAFFTDLGMAPAKTTTAPAAKAAAAKAPANLVPGQARNEGLPAPDESHEDRQEGVTTRTRRVLPGADLVAAMTTAYADGSLAAKIRTYTGLGTGDRPIWAPSGVKGHSVPRCAAVLPTLGTPSSRRPGTSGWLSPPMERHRGR